MDYVKDVRELAEAGFTVEKIARIVYGDAHPMCVELVNIDLSEIKYREDRGVVALFFDDVARHQKNMEDGAWFSNNVHPLIDEFGGSCDGEDMECTNCGACFKLLED